MIITLKTLPDTQGEFTITDGTNDYLGVVPAGMEGFEDRVILSFARGIAVAPEHYVAPTIPATRKMQLSIPTISIGDVLFDDTEQA